MPLHYTGANSRMFFTDGRALTRDLLERLGARRLQSGERSLPGDVYYDPEVDRLYWESVCGLIVEETPVYRLIPDVMRPMTERNRGDPSVHRAPISYDLVKQLWVPVPQAVYLRGGACPLDLFLCGDRSTVEFVFCPGTGRWGDYYRHPIVHACLCEGTPMWSSLLNLLPEERFRHDDLFVPTSSNEPVRTARRITFRSTNSRPLPLP